MKCATPAAVKLFHEGSLVLARMSANGMKIDELYLASALTKVKTEISELETTLRDDKVYRIWQKKYGIKTNLDSVTQLGKIIFGEMGYPNVGYTPASYDEDGNLTDKAQYRADEAAFEHVDLPFVKTYLRTKHLKKLKSTYLEGVLRELVDGFMHPVFSLHTTITYRSSSELINFQNLPVRNSELSRYIRSCIIPRGKHRSIVEVDFGGIEVKAGVPYHKDPMMIRYVTDPTTDMHRDMAIECYLLPKDLSADWWSSKEGGKNPRYCAKNKFVFPQFYGSFYPDCARALWEAIDQMNLVNHKGVPMKEHLHNKGIVKLGKCDPSHEAIKGTFEHHIKEVEKDFWNRRFKVYRDWKKSWYREYLRKGYIETLTGFRVEGVFDRNQIINNPIQGDAFHYLLQSAIDVDRKIRKRKMDVLPIGQIHDSIIADCHEEEVDAYLKMVKKVTTVDLPEKWKFINVPLSVEAEVSPPGKSWFEKRKVEL